MIDFTIELSGSGQRSTTILLHFDDEPEDGELGGREPKFSEIVSAVSTFIYRGGKELLEGFSVDGTFRIDQSLKWDERTISSSDPYDITGGEARAELLVANISYKFYVLFVQLAGQYLDQ